MFLDVTHGIPDHVHHRVAVRNGGAGVDAVHQDSADDVAPDEGIQILRLVSPDSWFTSARVGIAMVSVVPQPCGTAA